MRLQRLFRGLEYVFVDGLRISCGQNQVTISVLNGGNTLVGVAVQRLCVISSVSAGAAPSCPRLVVQTSVTIVQPKDGISLKDENPAQSK